MVTEQEIYERTVVPVIQPSMSFGHASSVFDASSVTSATLEAWYDFSDASTLFQDQSRTTPVTADGQNLRGASDKSGNAFHLIDSGAGNITYHTATQNGNSSMRVNGTSGNFMEHTGAMINVQPITVFAVGQWRTSPPPSGFASILVGPRSGSPRIQIGLANVLGPDDGELIYCMPTHTDSSVLTTWTGNGGNWYAVVAEANHPNNNTWVGNTVDLVNFSAGGVGHYGTGIRLGEVETSGHGWNSDIGEVIVYSGLLSTADRVALTTALTTKWATAIS